MYKLLSLALLLFIINSNTNSQIPEEYLDIINSPGVTKYLAWEEDAMELTVDFKPIMSEIITEEIDSYIENKESHE